MAKKNELPPPDAFITIRRRDDFTFEMIEIRKGVEKMLLAEIFPIVLDKSMEWMQKEAGVL